MSVSSQHLQQIMIALDAVDVNQFWTAASLLTKYTLDTTLYTGDTIVSTTTPITTLENIVRAASPKSRTSGKLYFEVTLIDNGVLAAGSNYMNTFLNAFGIGETGKSPTPIATGPVAGYYNTDYCLASWSSRLYTNNNYAVLSGTGSHGYHATSTSVSMTLGVAVDLDNGLIWFSAHPTLWKYIGAPGTPDNGVGGYSITQGLSYVPIGCIAFGGVNAQLNTDGPFDRPIPSGFSAWG